MSDHRASRPSATELASCAPQEANGVPAAVAQLLQAAVAARASDLHLLPTRAGLELAWRLDGVMQPLAVWPGALAGNVMGRLKVLAELLTYRTDLPQEGRLRSGDESVEMRLSTFPTLHGEKGVIRLFIGSGSYQTLNDLGLPDSVRQPLCRQLEETTGCLVFAGPAGSGKTTTAYACVREILHSQHSGKSITTLEDPVEAEIPGISQSQVHRPADFTYALGLRSLMRQDPDVILVGEIRDRETAETVFQASLTGHLVLTTLHAGSAAQGVTRLRDLGVEPYLLRAGLRGMLCQRLLRQRCTCQHDPAATAGCPQCWQTGYRGRFLISEFLVPEVLPESLAELGIIPAEQLQRRAAEAGMVLLRQSAADAVAAGRTTPAEVLRVLGSGAIPLK